MIIISALQTHHAKIFVVPSKAKGLRTDFTANLKSPAEMLRYAQHDRIFSFSVLSFTPGNIVYKRNRPACSLQDINHIIAVTNNDKSKPRVRLPPLGGKLSAKLTDEGHSRSE